MGVHIFKHCSFVIPPDVPQKPVQPPALQLPPPPEFCRICVHVQFPDEQENVAQSGQFGCVPQLPPPPPPPPALQFPPPPPESGVHPSMHACRSASVGFAPQAEHISPVKRRPERPPLSTVTPRPTTTETRSMRTVVLSLNEPATTRRMEEMNMECILGMTNEQYSAHREFPQPPEFSVLSSSRSSWREKSNLLPSVSPKTTSPSEHIVPSPPAL